MFFNKKPKFDPPLVTKISGFHAGGPGSNPITTKISGFHAGGPGSNPISRGGVKIWKTSFSQLF